MSTDRSKQLTHDPSRDEVVAGVGDDGLITVRGGLSVLDAIDRIAATVTSRGMQVFARIDHAGAAAHAGLTLRPTALLIFGNPTGARP